MIGLTGLPTRTFRVDPTITGWIDHGGDPVYRSCGFHTVRLSSRRSRTYVQASRTIAKKLGRTKIGVCTDAVALYQWVAFDGALKFAVGAAGFSLGQARAGVVWLAKVVGGGVYACTIAW